MSNADCAVHGAAVKLIQNITARQMAYWLYCEIAGVVLFLSVSSLVLCLFQIILPAYPPCNKCLLCVNGYERDVEENVSCLIKFVDNFNI